MALDPRLLGIGDEALEHELDRHLLARRRNRERELAQAGAHEGWKGVVFRRDLVAEVGRIAAEQLIRALAAENHLHVLARGAGQEERRQDGRIGERQYVK